MKLPLFLSLWLFSFIGFSQNCYKTSVYFKTDNYKLESKYLKKIKQQLSELKNENILSIKIEGFTDSVGPTSYNKQLAEKRINTIYSILKIELDSSIKFETENFNELFPASIIDLSKNRRVDITFNILKNGSINIANKSNGNIWLNGEIFKNLNPCKPSLRIYPSIIKADSFLNKISIPKKTEVYLIADSNDNCIARLYYFPEIFFNPKKKIGHFEKSVYLGICGSNKVDSLDFRNTNYLIQFDSISRGYYIIGECNIIHGVCCNTKGCYIYVPDETENHITTITRSDTLVYSISDSIFWKHPCISLAKVFSLAKFESKYYFIKDSLDIFRVEDGIFKLERYNSFNYTDSTIIVKVKGKGSPGFYLTDFNGLIPLDRKSKKKYKGCIIDYPFEIGILKEKEIIRSNNLEIKRRLKRKKLVLKVQIKK